MPRENPEDFIPLKANWFHIMLTLAEGPRHGYSIMQEVAERTGGKVRLWPATLYGSIHRLEQAGMLEELEDRETTEPDDERRRYYDLTPIGRSVLAAEVKRLEGLVQLAYRKGAALP